MRERRISIEEQSDSLKRELFWLDLKLTMFKIRENISRIAQNLKINHENKLKKLGIDCIKFINPNSIIFNYSDVTLNWKQKASLGVGLDYSLPTKSVNIYLNRNIQQ